MRTTATFEMRAAKRSEELTHAIPARKMYWLNGGGLVVGSKVLLTFLGPCLPAPRTPVLEMEATMIDHYVPHNDGCYVFELSDGRVIHLDPYSPNEHTGADGGWDGEELQEQTNYESDIWCYYGQTGVGDGLVPTPEGDDSDPFNDDWSDGDYHPVPYEDRVLVPIGICEDALFGAVKVRLLER
jgi:hypothetical protein